MLVVTPSLKIPSEELRMTFARSAGPGGQNVNKLNTKATLRWDVLNTPSLPEEVRKRFLAHQRRRITVGGELVISSQRFRTAGRNATDCLDKLRDMLVAALRSPRPRRSTRPTRGSIERRLTAKRQQSEKKTGRRAGADI
ncbi:MAG: alternative ribosome rescue aminoacyl-tRNA hydrolase ArfB [Planctomycetota bacterium]